MKKFYKSLIILLCLSLFPLFLSNIFDYYSDENNQNPIKIIPSSSKVSQFWNYSTNNDIKSSPALGDIDDDGDLEVVFGSDDSHVYALEVNDGTQLWNYTTNSQVFSSPALGDIDNDGELEVFIGSGHDNYSIYAIEGKDGTKIWNYTISDKIESSPALGDIDNDDQLELVVGSDEGIVYALEANNGTQLWNHTIGGIIRSSPALGDIDDDGELEVIIGSYDNYLYALEGKNGTELWNFQTDDYIFSSPALGDIDNDGNLEVVFGSDNNFVYALEGNNGTQIWNFTTKGEEVKSSPALGDIDDDGKLEVVFGSYDNFVYALQGNNGTEIWSYETGNSIFSSPTLGDLNGDEKLDIVIGSSDMYLYALEGQNGTQLWNYSTSDGVDSSPILGDLDKDGRVEVVFCGKDQYIYALKISSSGRRIYWQGLSGDICFRRNSNQEFHDPDFDMMSSYSEKFYILYEFGVAKVNFTSWNASNMRVGIGDTLRITYENDTHIESVSANLTDYGGSPSENLYNDGTHGDQIGDDSVWTLDWIVSDPAPYGIEQTGPVDLTLTANNGTNYDIDQATIYYYSPLQNQADIDTITPTIISFETNIQNISATSGDLTIELTFSEDVEPSTGYSNIISFSPDLIANDQLNYHSYVAGSDNINITYSVNTSHLIGTFLNNDVSVSNIRENKTTPGYNSLRNGTQTFLDVFSIDIKHPENPDSFNAYSHVENGYSDNNTIYIDWSGQSDEGSGIKGFYISWDELPSYIPNPNSDYFTISSSNFSTPLEDGTWYLHIHTIDNFENRAGEIGTTSAFHIGPFHIDTINPFVGINSPNNETTHGSIAPDFSLVLDDMNLEISWYSLDGGQTNHTFTGTSGKIIPQSTWDTLPEGEITITFYANDSAGNVGSRVFVVYKDLSVDNGSTNGIGGYEIVFLIACISIISIAIILKKKQQIQI